MRTRDLLGQLRHAETWWARRDAVLALRAERGRSVDEALAEAYRTDKSYIVRSLAFGELMKRNGSIKTQALSEAANDPDRLIRDMAAGER